MASEEEARQVKRRHSAELLRLPDIAGVGVEKDERGEFVLAIHLESDDPELLRRVPTEIEGLPVKLLPSGPFRKLSAG